MPRQMLGAGWRPRGPGPAYGVSQLTDCPMVFRRLVEVLSALNERDFIILGSNWAGNIGGERPGLDAVRRHITRD